MRNTLNKSQEIKCDQAKIFMKFVFNVLFFEEINFPPCCLIQRFEPVLMKKKLRHLSPQSKMRKVSAFVLLFDVDLMYVFIKLV